MNCTEFEQWLFEQIEQRSSLSDIDPPAHFTQCEQCRALWEEQLLLDRLIPHWRTRLPAVDLVAAVKSQVLQETSHSQNTHPQAAPALETVAPPLSRPRGHLLSLVTACASLMIVTLLIFSQRSPTDPETASTSSSPQKVTIVEADTKPVPPPEDQLQPEVRELIGGASSAYLALGRDLKDAVKDASILLPAVPWDTQQMPAEESNDPGWVENVSQDIKPIGRKMTKAVGFLRKAVPSGLSERL